MAYEEFMDPGIAFSDTTLAEWNPLAWATQRVNYLKGLHRQLDALSAVSEKPKWIEVTKKCMRVTVPQYVRIGADGPSEEDAPQVWFAPMTPAARKKMLAGIEHSELEDWIADWVQDIRTSLSHVVSIGAAAVASGRKDVRRPTNQVANVLFNHELRQATKRQTALHNEVDRLKKLNA